MRVTAPAPVTYLPETLFLLFSRPGRELTVRVIEVEGKTLTLEAGGERFQARIAGTLFPEDFRPGESVRVRVVSSGPPVLLQIVESERLPQAEARLLQVIHVVQKLAPEVVRRLKGVSERPNVEDLVSVFVKLLEEDSPEKDSVQRVFIQERSLFVPFVFSDKVSWGLLEIGREPKEGKGASSSMYYLRLFLSELGLVEAFLLLQGVSKLSIRFYFSRDEALELARAHVAELKKELGERGFYSEISLEKSHYEPGVIIAYEG